VSWLGVKKWVGCFFFYPSIDRLMGKTNCVVITLKPYVCIACQDVFPPKGFDMKNRPKLRVRPVDYHLECCIVARFREMAISGRTK
jgi:hypothetical protein